MFKKIFVIMMMAFAMAHSYSYTILPPITEKGVFTINPAFFADDINSGGMECFLYYGLTDKLDISSSIVTYNGSSDFFAMLRYDFGDSKIIGVKANESLVIPSFLVSFENDLVYFQSMIGMQFVYDYADKPAMYGILCPGLKVGKIDIFTEVGFGYYMQDGDFANCYIREKGVGVDIAPGIGFGIGNALFSIAVPIYNVNYQAKTTFGAWFCYSIKAKN